MFNSILNYLQYLPRKFVISLAAVLALVLPLVAIAGWGPDRPIKDWNVPADRVGFDHVVFNSFINTPNYGDERTFFDGRSAANNTSPWLDNVTIAPGQEYTLRIYVHNNGNQELNDDPGQPTVAKNTRVRVDLPGGTARTLQARATISADNAQPPAVFDTVDFTSSTANAVSLKYVPGSARAFNNANPNATAVSDSIVTAAGAPIGFETMNGTMPGCFEFVTYVTLRVRVDVPTISINKQVRILGQSTLVESVNAAPGQTLEWVVNYTNTGTQLLTNVTVRDQLPAHLTLVSGSVHRIDPNHPWPGQQLSDTGFFSAAGFNAGSYAPNGGGYIYFQTRINDDFANCNPATLVNRGFVKSTETAEISDTAQVVVQPPCQFRCVSLTASSTTGPIPLTVTFTAQAHADTGVTIQRYLWDFGDGNTANTAGNTAQHTYNNHGTFIANVRVQTSEGTTTVTSNCQVQIIVNLPQKDITLAPCQTGNTVFCGAGAGGTRQS